MFKNQYKQKYEKQKYIKHILYIVRPEIYFMWHDIDTLLEHNYPIKNIIQIIRKKYNVQSKTN